MTGKLELNRGLFPSGRKVDDSQNGFEESDQSKVEFQNGGGVDDCHHGFEVQSNVEFDQSKVEFQNGGGVDEDHNDEVQSELWDIFLNYLSTFYS